jgi:uncharacterized protein (DUF1330 family)
MSAYIVGDITVHDTERYMKYVSRAPDFVNKHSGKYLVRGGDMEVSEGDWNPQRVVVIEFPSMEDAQGFLQDPEYQAIAEDRRAATTSRLIVVEGASV